MQFVKHLIQLKEINYFIDRYLICFLNSRNFNLFFVKFQYLISILISLTSYSFSAWSGAFIYLEYVWKLNNI